MKYHIGSILYFSDARKYIKIVDLKENIRTNWYIISVCDGEGKHVCKPTHNKNQRRMDEDKSIILAREYVKNKISIVEDEYKLKIKKYKNRLIELEKIPL